MQLSISLPSETPKQGIINLKNFIDKSSIEGIEKTEIQRANHKENAMGAGDILSTIVTVITIGKSLVDLVGALQKYVKDYRSEITLSDGKGRIIILNANQKSDRQAIEEIVKSLFEKT